MCQVKRHHGPGAKRQLLLKYRRREAPKVLQGGAAGPAGVHGGGAPVNKEIEKCARVMQNGYGYAKVRTAMQHAQGYANR